MTTPARRLTPSRPWSRVRLLQRFALVSAPLVLFALTLPLAGCGRSPASPSDQGPLTLSASISASVIAPGEVSTLTFRLENTGPTQMSLTFADGCQVLPFIDDGRTGRTVYPNGGWACTLAITQLVLPPGGAKTISVSVGAAGAAISAPSASLPPGTYLAYAELKHSTYPLRSKSVAFKVE